MLRRTQVYKGVIGLLLLVQTSLSVFANEGMWLLSMLMKYNAEELRRMGLKIPAEMLTGENPGALSEAVVAFGSGCTGSLISDQGLILTNYHCSYGAIQQHNTAVADITRNGFWAQSQKEELPVNGLTITINRKIIDISAEVQKIINASGPNKISSKDALATLVDTYQKQYPQLKVLTRSYKNNSLFVLYLQQQYHDVRLVGLGPKNITKFGGESDNWTWPRQSADFAYFRVYASKTGSPAAYNSANVPLVVKTFLKISAEGYKQGDFAMSLGYPGNTDRNALAAKIWEKVTVVNPATIAVRKQRLQILEDSMAANSTARLAYAEAYSTTANEYKNAVGMNEWVNKLDIIGKKQHFESGIVEGWNEGQISKASLDTALNKIWTSTRNNAPYVRALNYLTETFTNSCEVTRFVSAFGRGFVDLEKIRKERPSFIQDNLSNISNYYKKFVPSVDRQITRSLMQLLADSLPKDLLPDVFITNDLFTHAAIEKYVDDLFTHSILADSITLKQWLKNPTENIAEDPAIKLHQSIERKTRELRNNINNNLRLAGRSSSLFQMAIERQADQKFYPDADKTLRLSYGTISDLNVDGKALPFQTKFSSLINKADTVNKDYQLNPLLAEMWRKKDFGTIGQNGDMPVCFITNGDVTGGNSGSPMLNGDGKLIGLVFDCNWESMTRDFNFEQSFHRVICADIRYVLLLTEKCSQSKRILDEIAKAN